MSTHVHSTSEGDDVQKIFLIFTFLDDGVGDAGRFVVGASWRHYCRMRNEEWKISYVVLAR